MKRLLILLVLISLIATPAFAFVYEVEILSKEEISKLSKDELSEIYSEAKVEEVASAEFHEAAGFSNAKDYKKRKDLLRFILNLRREMEERGITPEPIDQWLK